jgi:hypothetical protein
LFVANPSGGVYTALGNPNYEADRGPFAGFGGWRSVSEGSTTPGAPVTAVTQGNNVALFIADPNGGVYTASGDPNYEADHGPFAGFGGWGSVSQVSTMPGAPVTAAPQGQRLDLFVSDRTGGVLSTFDLLISASPGQWASIGPTRIDDGGAGAIGQLTAIAIDPTDPSTMYVGGGRCGLWKTVSGGATWGAIGDSLPSMAIAAIAVDPTNRSTVYVATDASVFGFGGVFRSHDGGITWTQISNDQQAQVIFGQLIVDPANPSVLYLTCSQGVRRSSDGGATWPLVLTGRAVTAACTGLVLDPTNTSTLYAAIAGVGVFKTTTGGQGGNADWTKLGSGLPTSGFSNVRLALCGANPATVYASVRTTAGFQMFRTTDGGLTWALRSTLPLTNLTNDVIGVDQTNPAIVYTGGKDFFRSTDGGVTFSNKNAPHVDHHGFATDPVTSSTIYTVGDGGIFRSSDRGDSWILYGAGIANVMFFDIAISPTDPDLVIGGTQDNGTLKYHGGGTAWREFHGGDGGTVAIDPTDANILYAMNQDIDTIVRFTDGGAGAGPSPANGGLPHGKCVDGATRPPYWQVHPTQSGMLLASCKALWRSTSFGTGWYQVLSPFSGDSVVRSAVEPTVDTTNDRYYAACATGDLYASVGGDGWSLIFSLPSGLRPLPVFDLCIDPVNPGIVYATFGAGGSSGRGRIFRLLCPGPGLPALPIAFSDITTNLPLGLPAQAIAVHPRLQTLFVGTNRGVFQGVSADNGVTWSWSPYNNGLPPADVGRLLFSRTGLLRAGTFGRGAHEVFVGWAG